MSLAEQETAMLDQPTPERVAIALPEGAPDFDSWDDSDKLTYICASIFSLKSDIAQVKALAGQVAVQAEPIIQKVSKSPLFKLIG